MKEKNHSKKTYLKNCWRIRGRHMDGVQLLSVRAKDNRYEEILGSKTLRKQQLLSREEVKLVLDTENNLVHFKRCRLLKTIGIDHLQEKKNLSTEDKVCRQCMVQAYVSQGTQYEDIEKTYKLLKRIPSMNEKTLRILFLICGCRTYALTDKLYITTQDNEKWYIQISSNGKNLRLFHNNYRVVNGTRIVKIPVTYHEQYRSCSFHSILLDILHYDWVAFHTES